MAVHVLYIEDNPPNITVVTRIVESLGYKLTVATTAEEGLHHAFHDQPDIILMDVGLPDMDGLTATRSIRTSDSPIRDIPIIAITASAMVGDREKCIEAGCDDYIAKPFQVKTLVDALHRCLQQIGKI